MRTFVCSAALGAIASATQISADAKNNNVYTSSASLPSSDLAAAADQFNFESRFLEDQEFQTGVQVQSDIFVAIEAYIQHVKLGVEVTDELRNDAEGLQGRIATELTPALDKLKDDVEGNRSDIENNSGDISENAGHIVRVNERLDDLAHRVCKNHDGLVLFCHRFIYTEFLPEECRPILADMGDRLGVQYDWNGAHAVEPKRQTEHPTSWACEWGTGSPSPIPVIAEPEEPDRQTLVADEHNFMDIPIGYCLDRAWYGHYQREWDLEWGLDVTSIVQGLMDTGIRIIQASDANFTDPPMCSDVPEKLMAEVYSCDVEQTAPYVPTCTDMEDPLCVFEHINSYDPTTEGVTRNECIEFVMFQMGAVEEEAINHCSLSFWADYDVNGNTMIEYEEWLMYWNDVSYNLNASDLVWVNVVAPDTTNLPDNACVTRAWWGANPDLFMWSHGTNVGYDCTREVRLAHHNDGGLITAPGVCDVDNNVGSSKQLWIEYLPDCGDYEEFYGWFAETESVNLADSASGTQFSHEYQSIYIPDGSCVSYAWYGHPDHIREIGHNLGIDCTPGTVENFYEHDYVKDIRNWMCTDPVRGVVKDFLIDYEPCEDKEAYYLEHFPELF